jgi:DNA-binding LytR/AlgR family response regulator
MKFLWILILYFESSQDAVSIIYELKNNAVINVSLLTFLEMLPKFLKISKNYPVIDGNRVIIYLKIYI